MSKPEELDGDLDEFLNRAFTTDGEVPGRRPVQAAAGPAPGPRTDRPADAARTAPVASSPAGVANGPVQAAPPPVGQPHQQVRPPAARVGGESTSLTEVLTIGILLTDSDGIVRNSNAAAGRLFGIRTGTLEGTRVIELFDSADRGALGVLLGDAFRGRPPHEVDLSAVGHEGPVRVKVTAAGRFDQQGHLRQVVWTIRECETSPLAVDVRVHSSKVEVLAELGLELGREVGPLIMKMSDALVSAQHLIDPLPEEVRGAERDRLRDRLAEATSALVRIQQVVTELDRFAIDSPLKIEAVDPAAVFDRAKTLLGRSLRNSRVRVRNEMDDPAPKVMADASRLTEILVNLLRNARNAIGRRFELAEAEAKGGAKRIVTVESAVKDPYVCLVVTNNGLPIPAADQERIFLPSFAARDPERTGFGLPETAALMKQMGGAIRCQALGDQGTRFLLTFQKAS